MGALRAKLACLILKNVISPAAPGSADGKTRIPDEKISAKKLPLVKVPIEDKSVKKAKFWRIFSG